MPYEYLVVLFPRRRRVKVNQEFMGYTNFLLELQGGRYEIALGPPQNFTPKMREIDLRNTSRITPMIVEFKDAPK